MKKKEDKKFKLLVEGNDDQHVVWALTKYYDLLENFDVIDCESNYNVLKQLELRLKSPQTNERIGIVVDADENLNSRWEQIRSILKKNFDPDIPETLPSEGLVMYSNSESIIVGVWIMPNNELNGMLEDFVAMFSDTNDILMIEAEKILTQLEINGSNKYKKVHRSKAKIHTYLAWQDEPGKPIGLSITANVLKADSEIAKKFNNWLVSLFKD